jgi:hypothetical protein
MLIRTALLFIASMALLSSVAVARESASTREPSCTAPLHHLSVAVEHQAINYTPCMISGRNEFKTASGEPGIVSDKAMVAMENFGGRPLAVALDVTDESETFNVLRLDFTGDADFSKAVAVPLEVEQRDEQLRGTLTPTTCLVQNAQGVKPVLIRGDFYRWGSGSDAYYRLQLNMGFAGQAECEVDGQPMVVRIVDGNGNAELGDRMEPVRLNGRTAGLDGGDTVIISAGGERSRACYGQPIRVGKHWYDVSVGKEGRTVTVTPTQVAMGRLHVPQDRWWVQLVGERFIYEMGGSSDPVEIPVDNYLVLHGNIALSSDHRGSPAMVNFNAIASEGARSVLVEVNEGQTTELNLGSPLNATVDIDRRGNRHVEFNLRLTEVNGMHVQWLTLENSQRPPQPTVEVIDEAGDVVHTGKMEYG